jgi:poly-beta-hydroxybutyrate-responsive repressor
MAGKNGKNIKSDTVENTVEEVASQAKENLDQAAEAAKTTAKATDNIAQPTLEELEEAAEAKAKTERRGKVEESEAEVGFSPKTFLIPYMLLMLRDSLMHGYDIWKNLIVMGIPGLTESDRATIYRILRQLEREGKVKSEWDTSTEGHGPARRVYSLTDAGESFLQIWAVGLNQYRQSLDFFFKMYTGGALPSPYDFFSRGKFGKNSKGDK